MKICVPSEGNGDMEAPVCPHFGMASKYTIYDSDDSSVTVVANTSEHKGGKGYPPEIIRDTGAKVMLCGGLGRKAVQMFESFGIEVYCGAQGTVGDAIKAYEAGSLQKATMDTACAGHGHDHGHDHDHSA